MGFECRVERDSVSPAGIRLTTFVVTYPRIIHCELLTHRSLSRNSSSSRAIPVAKMIQALERDPYVPSEWGTNQKGMQAGGPLGENESELCRLTWLTTLRYVVWGADILARANVHKQLVNRLLEPFSWITVVASATDWANFFALRCHPDAQPEIRKIAEMMREARRLSVPRRLEMGQWHLPFLSESEEGIALRNPSELPLWKKVSAGRCARVSYLQHSGVRDVEKDVELADRLTAAIPKHISSFEHQATPIPAGSKGLGNFLGWRQYRHEFADESVPG